MTHFSDLCEIKFCASVINWTEKNNLKPDTTIERFVSKQSNKDKKRYSDTTL